MRVHPAANLDFRHRSGDLYEAFVCRNLDPEQEQPVFKIFPEAQEFSSGDLFSPTKDDNDKDLSSSCSSKSQLWRYRGRADDMQVFSSGEKYHPVGVEQLIVAKCADVQEALFVGTGRPQAALMLELKPGTEPRNNEQRVEALERVWPVVEEANLMCPIYATITQNKVLFTESERPMSRAAKGTVQRLATMQLYAEELNALFH